jgi:NADH-quinone oxidoreductase subunit N
MGNVAPLQLDDSVRETLHGLGALGQLLVLVVGIVGVLAWDWFLTRERSRRVSWAAFAVLLGGIALLMPTWKAALAAPVVVGWGMLVVDPFAVFLWLFFLVATFVVVAMSRSSAELQGRRVGEYYALLLTATLAACFLVASRNLVVLYLSFETLSLSSYVLAGYAKDRRESVESSLKYVLFGAVASGVMLYGFSLLYGMVGSLDLRDIARVAGQNPASYLLVVVLVLAGLSFKMSLVPFHFWAPDVYQGALTPITAYLSVVSKAAGFGIALRFFAPLLGAGIFEWLPPETFTNHQEFALLSVLWVLATLTMCFGNFVALRQRDFKRLLAYSSIAHAGYMAAALVAANGTAYSAILFYFAVYAVANLGLFFAAQVVAASKGTFGIDGFRGLVHESPMFVVSTGFLLWSLIGLPPSGGFLGKFFLFYALVERAMSSPLATFYYALIFIALANSVVSLYYYMGVIRQMAFYAPPEDRPALRVPFGAQVGMALAAALLLAVQLDWQPLTDITHTAVQRNAPAAAVAAKTFAASSLPAASGGSQ